MVWNDPRSAGGLVRDGLVGIWRARGGGLYGLGYLITFLFLEARLAVTQFEGSESLASFLTEELLEYLFRLGFMSLVNVVLALLWPIFLLEHLGAWGLVLLVGGYVVFERWLRGPIEAAVPELRRSPRRSRRRRSGTEDQRTPGAGSRSMGEAPSEHADRDRG